MVALCFGDKQMMPQAHVAQPAGPNLREHPRHKFNGSGTLSIPSSRERHTGAIVDLSVGGCRLQFPEPVAWEVGTIVELNLQSSYLAVRTRASIRHSSASGTLLGFQFEGLSERGTAQIREQLNDLELVPDAGATARTDGSPGISAEV
jgi:hypothetical protein